MATLAGLIALVVPRPLELTPELMARAGSPGFAEAGGTVRCNAFGPTSRELPYAGSLCRAAGLPRAALVQAAGPGLGGLALVVAAALRKARGRRPPEAVAGAEP